MALGPLKYSSITAVIGLTEEGIFLVVTFSNEEARFSISCLSINTMFTLMARGVCVIVGVREDVTVAVADGLSVNVLEGLISGMAEADAVAVAVKTAVTVGVLIMVGVYEDVTVTAAVVAGGTVAEFVLVPEGGTWVKVDVNGSDVGEGVDEMAAVIVKSVSPGTSVWVAAGDANSCSVIKGASDNLGFESSENTTSKTPMATNAPKVEKAICALTLFCRRRM
jgi:hypothetical protein